MITRHTLFPPLGWGLFLTGLLGLWATFVWIAGTSMMIRLPGENLWAHHAKSMAIMAGFFSLTLLGRWILGSLWTRQNPMLQTMLLAMTCLVALLIGTGTLLRHESWGLAFWILILMKTHAPLSGFKPG